MIDYLKSDSMLSEYDRLYNDKQTKKKREGAFNFIKEYLEKNISEELSCLGIDEDMLSGFLKKDKKAIERVIEIITNNKERLELSARNISAINNSCKDDTQVAFEMMKDFIIKKKYKALYEKAGITAKSWRELKNFSVYTNEKTQEKLAEAMNLSAQQSADFKELFLNEIFSVSDELKKETLEKCKDTKMSITEFLISCDVSQSTWEKITNIKKKNEVISQKTLLKFVNSFGTDKISAEEYMNKAGSGFYTSYDIIFLVCICFGYYGYYQVLEVMQGIFGIEKI